MTAQKGKDLLVKIADGAGLHHRRRPAHAPARVQRRDRRHHACRKRQSLARTARRRRRQARLGVGPRPVQGRLDRRADAADLLRRHGRRIIRSSFPDFGTVQGAFQITSLEFAGEHNGEVTYDMALEIGRRADVYGGCDHAQQTSRRDRGRDRRRQAHAGAHARRAGRTGRRVRRRRSGGADRALRHGPAEGARSHAHHRRRPARRGRER